MKQICPSSEPFNFSDPCIRQAWSSFLPAVLVLIICLSNIPIRIPDRLNFAVFTRFLDLNDAVALDAVAEKTRRAADGEILEEAVEEVDVVNKDAKPPLWRTFLLCTIALIETLAWVAYGSFRVIISQKHAAHSDDTEAFYPALVLPFILALPWLYALIRPLLRPPLTPPYDLLVLYLAHLAMGVIMLGAVLFNHTSYGTPLPETWGLVGLVGNLVLVVLGLVLIVSVKMAVPPKGVSPDDVVCISLPIRDHTSVLIIRDVFRAKPSHQKITPLSGPGSPSAGSTRSSRRGPTRPCLRRTYGTFLPPCNPVPCSYSSGVR